MTGATQSQGDAASTRLGRLFPLSAEDRAALARAVQLKTSFPARREVLKVGDPIRRASILLAGWACRVRDLRDGRRQILDFILPGELIGLCHHCEPRALASVTALTPLVTCPAPDAAKSASLAQAYAMSAAHTEAAMLRQITRLGRLDALERTADLLLELHDRLQLSGSAGPSSFALPVTQETLADMLGLTSVHVNRTLQIMRRQGLLVLTAGTVTMPDRPALQALVEHTVADVTSMT